MTPRKFITRLSNGLRKLSRFLYQKARQLAPPLLAALYKIMNESIDYLRREAETTLRLLQALKGFRLAVSRPEDVDLINQNPDFWRIYEVSIRTNLFIGIRRLYENKNGTFNFQKFIDSCISNLSAFSKNELRKRKSSAHNSKQWLENYMAHVYEPTEEDFRNLAKLVRENSKKMKGIYIDAASKIYAHAIHMDHPDIVRITDQLNFEEIETALDSIWHCYEQVWQLYQNGRKPSLEINEYPYKEEVFESFKKQLEAKHV